MTGAPPLLPETLLHIPLPSVRTFGVLLLALALLIVCAKMHGRQVRLRREAAGYADADFRRTDNPPYVGKLWRRDRQVFWSLMAGLAIVSGGVLMFRGPDAMGVTPVLLAIAWTASGAFTGAAVWWAADLARAGEAPRGAWRGTFGWAALALLLLAGQVALIFA